MPTYEYLCRECGTRLEVVQSFSDDSLTVCDDCGGELRKVFSAAGLIFKGSGWHIKDYSGSGSGASGATSGPRDSGGSKGSSGPSDASGSKDASNDASKGAKSETGSKDPGSKSSDAKGTSSSSPSSSPSPSSGSSSGSD